MVTIVFWHFGFGALALLIRKLEQPIRSCSSCFWKCAAPSWYAYIPAIRWYWFHLAMQVSFMYREFLVISLLDGWVPFVLAAHISCWLTILFVTKELWLFSKRRSSTKLTEAVDGVLDMLLLPIHIAFYTEICVRILRLQPESQSRTMVSAVMESADIWEAFALWSVLDLFARVVDRQFETMDAMFDAFKNLSVQGVKAWVWALTGVVAFNLILKGVVALRVPTLCFKLFDDCEPCTEWYDKHVEVAATSVTFILCSFALVFVFTFEHTFSEALVPIKPFWKFWGVKGVVSVTYFQWLIIRFAFGWSEDTIYSVHCLLVAVEMPILAIVHAFVAYPPNKPWLDNLLLESSESAMHVEFLKNTIEPSRSSAAGSNSPTFTPEAEISLIPIDEEQDDSSSQQACCVNRLFFLLLYFLFGAACCYSCTVLLLYLVPPQADIDSIRPMYTFTCTDGDLLDFVQEKTELHLIFPNGTANDTSLRMPGIAGAWLPLCGSIRMGCADGFRGHPLITCSPAGKYTWGAADEMCRALSCGQPPHLLHAAARFEDISRQDWTTGERVGYDCDLGFQGDLWARCGANGQYTVVGKCSEMVCLRPPAVPHAKPLIDANQTNWSTGIILQYECEGNYLGAPNATCGDEGLYVVSGRCFIKCGVPPVVENAIADVSESNESLVVIEGMRVPYRCASGYGGKVIAVCGQDGSYTAAGACKIECGVLPNYLQQTLGDEWQSYMQAESREEIDFPSSGSGTVVVFNCSNGTHGRPLVSCSDGQWSILGDCGPVVTSLGCSCKKRWEFCTGWLQSVCQMCYGCSGRSSGKAGWCEIEPNSCPGDAKSATWDYCGWHAGGLDKDWPSAPITRENTVWFYALVAVAITALAAVVLVASRFIAARRQLLPVEESRHADAPSQDFSRSFSFRFSTSSGATEVVPAIAAPSIEMKSVVAAAESPDPERSTSVTAAAVFACRKLYSDTAQATVHSRTLEGSKVSSS